MYAVTYEVDISRSYIGIDSEQASGTRKVLLPTSEASLHKIAVDK